VTVESYIDVLLVIFTSLLSGLGTQLFIIFRLRVKLPPVTTSLTTQR